MPPEKLKNITVVYAGQMGYPVKVTLQAENFSAAEKVIDEACFKMGFYPTRIYTMRLEDAPI